MLRLAFDFIITWRETRTRPNAYATSAGNQQGKEGEILKSAIPYALAYVLITGVIVYIFS